MKNSLLIKSIIIIIAYVILIIAAMILYYLSKDGWYIVVNMILVLGFIPTLGIMHND